MKAAVNARNQVLLKATLEQVESSAAGLADPELLFAARIFQGFFLDVRYVPFPLPLPLFHLELIGW